MDLFKIVEQHASTQNIDNFRTAFDTIKNEVDHQILEQARIRPLSDEEIAFIKLMNRQRQRQGQKRIEAQQAQQQFIEGPRIEEVQISYPRNAVHCGLEYTMKQLDLNQQ